MPPRGLMLLDQSDHPLVNHTLSLTLTLSRWERGQRSPRAEVRNVSPLAPRGLRLSLPQRGSAGVEG